MTELSPAALKAIEKVKKLLAVTIGRGATEAEAASASAKAMEILDAHNLDMLTLERASGKTGARHDAKLSGGLYKWQRELWKYVAELHFCMHWSIPGLKKGEKYEHRVLGRQENVIGTRVMAEYLQDTIDRMAMEYIAGDARQRYSKSALSFREGMANRIAHRLYCLREERLAAERAARPNGTGGTTPGTALVLADVADAEEDANQDYIHGEGYSERRRQLRRDSEARWAREATELEQWRRDHPQEWAAQQAAEAAERDAWNKKQEKNEKRRKGSAFHGKAYKGDIHAYLAGDRKGEEVGLDWQVDEEKRRRVK